MVQSLGFAKEQRQIPIKNVFKAMMYVRLWEHMEICESYSIQWYPLILIRMILR